MMGEHRIQIREEEEESKAKQNTLNKKLEFKVTKMEGKQKRVQEESMAEERRGEQRR